VPGERQATGYSAGQAAGGVARQGAGAGFGAGTAAARPDPYAPAAARATSPLAGTVTNRGEAEQRQTPVTVDDKIGRNDPCPCGSGKKYKKCHGVGA
jgi:hypothetical protein